MKYIKRFNEELSPWTYRKAATNLVKKGSYHSKERAPKMLDYADLLEWKENKKRSQDFGVIRLELGTGINEFEAKNFNIEEKPNYVGEFHPYISIGIDMLNDHLDYTNTYEDTFFLNIFVNAVVTTEEGLNEMNKSISNFNKKFHNDRSTYREGGKVFMAYVDIKITLKDGSFEIAPLNFYENDDTQCGKIQILDRRSSGIIRNALIKEFDADDEYTIQFDGDKHTFTGPREAIDAMFARYGISSEYGISYDDIYDVIKSTPANTFTL